LKRRGSKKEKGGATALVSCKLLSAADQGIVMFNTCRGTAGETRRGENHGSLSREGHPVAKKLEKNKTQSREKKGRHTADFESGKVEKRERGG